MEDILDDPALDDLAADELSGLKLIVVQGRSPGDLMTSHLMARGLVMLRHGVLTLTRDGRRALVRGSPASWSLVA